MMPAVVTFTLTEHQVGDLKVVLILALLAVFGLALYERWPTWR